MQFRAVVDDHTVRRARDGWRVGDLGLWNLQGSVVQAEQRGEVVVKMVKPIIEEGLMLAVMMASVLIFIAVIATIMIGVFEKYGTVIP